MGYYTTYSLRTTERELNQEEWDKLEEIVGYEEIIFELKESGYYTTKWYEAESNIIELSKEFSDVVFVLDGVGEDNEDIWKAYFLNGGVQVAPAKIAFDEFDKSKLEYY